MVSEVRLIAEVEKEYPDEWLEIEVTQMADDGFTALEGRLIAHGKDRKKVSEIALLYYKEHDVKTTYSGYTGDITVEAIVL